MGFGEPLLAVRVGDAEVTLHRQEAASLLGSPVPLGSLHLMVLGPGGRGGYAPNRFLPTPNWPSDTQQFGVYYIRGPW